MQPRLFQRLVLASLVSAAFLATPFLATESASAGEAQEIQVGEYSISPEAMCAIRDQWIEQLVATYPEGSWAPLKVTLNDEQLAMMGLPSTEWLTSHRFDEPTAVHADGTSYAVALPPVAAYGGAGCFGIRPGAWLLLLDGGSVGWCSMAHVYGAPGSYDISTAGHCGRTGDRATVVAAFGPGGIPVLLDFGTFAKSTGDGGIGNDWALIDIPAQYQHLVSPTMCAWGGPLGMYTKTGATLAVTWGRRFPSTPGYSANPDPFLVQTIAHYGHGTGLGQGVGTARVGEAVWWGASYFTFFGAISPGDSGSGSNALGGDAVGQVNEAAGINTHIYVDGLQPMKTGTGYLAGTRATLVQGVLANGQVVPYPAPVPGAP